MAAVAATNPQGSSIPDLEQLFRRYHGQVYRAAYRITGNAADSEDVLQTVFLRMVRRDEQAEAVGNIGSYLHRAAVNAALDLMRSRQPGRSISLEEAEPDRLGSSEVSPERDVSSAELRAWLRRIVARLSPQAAEIFALRFFEGVENIEIARILGASQSTVAVTIHRIRERIQSEYRAEFGG